MRTLVRFAKKVVLKPTKACKREFSFNTFGGKEATIEKAKEFERLVKDIIQEFEGAKQHRRAEILAEHAFKAKKSVLETSVALQYHLYSGSSVSFEKGLKKTTAATCLRMPSTYIGTVHTYIIIEKITHTHSPACVVDAHACTHIYAHIDLKNGCHCCLFQLRCFLGGGGEPPELGGLPWIFLHTCSCIHTDDK